jgi:hypothetical protein
MPADAREFGKLAIILGVVAGVAIGLNLHRIKRVLNPVRWFRKG